MKTSFFSGWTKMRILRLVVGLIILGQGIYTHEWMWIILGGVFALFPILNFGCGCALPNKNLTESANLEEVDFEEIK